MYAPGLLRAAWCFRRPKADAFRPVPVREWAGPPGKTAADSQRISPSTIWRNQSQLRKYFFQQVQRQATTGQTRREDSPQTAEDFSLYHMEKSGAKNGTVFLNCENIFSTGPTPVYNRPNTPKDSPQTAEDFSLYHMEKSGVINGTIFFDGKNIF